MSLIYCACGCGGQREEFDKKGRPRKYIKGHFTKNKKCPEISGEDNPFFGKKHSNESKLKISLNHADVSGTNNPNYGKGLFGKDNGRYNGGKRLRKERALLKRRGLKFNPINTPISDDEVAHHLTTEYVAFIPAFLNKGYHNIHTGKNMDEVNFFVLNYLFLVYNKEE